MFNSNHIHIYTVYAVYRQVQQRGSDSQPEPAQEHHIVDDAEFDIEEAGDIDNDDFEVNYGEGGYGGYGHGGHGGYGGHGGHSP